MHTYKLEENFRNIQKSSNLFKDFAKYIIRTASILSRYLKDIVKLVDEVKMLKICYTPFPETV